MLSTKGLLALSTTGLGTAAVGFALYVSTNPRAFTTEAAPLPLATVAAIDAPTVTDAPAPASPVVEISVVAVRAKPATKPAEHRVRRPEATTQSALRRCSDWRTLENGREGRRVRELCQSTPSEPGG